MGNCLLTLLYRHQLTHCSTNKSCGYSASIYSSDLITRPKASKFARCRVLGATYIETGHAKDAHSGHRAAACPS